MKARSLLHWVLVVVVSCSPAANNQPNPGRGADGSGPPGGGGDGSTIGGGRSRAADVVASAGSAGTNSPIESAEVHRTSTGSVIAGGSNPTTPTSSVSGPIVAGGSRATLGSSSVVGSTDSLGVSSGAAAPPDLPPPKCASPVTLKEAASCTGRLIGVAVSNYYLGQSKFLSTASSEFNYATPSTAMKWIVTEATPGVFTFDASERVVDFAVQHGMKVKGHTLVWHDDLPAWVHNLSSADLKVAMLNHIQHVMAHYRDKYPGVVIAWDVVNEPFADDGVSIRDTPFSRAYGGSSYIDEAFKAARAADPNAKLYINDYEPTSNKANLKEQMMAAKVKDMLSKGVPIDGVGMQAHCKVDGDKDPSLADFKANMQSFTDMGLEVALSEMDVRMCDGGDFIAQRQRYHDLIAICIANPRCTSVTIWGVIDESSFYNERPDLNCTKASPPRALLWDDDYNKKPAFNGVLEALAGH